MPAQQKKNFLSLSSIYPINWVHAENGLQIMKTQLTKRVGLAVILLHLSAALVAGQAGKNAGKNLDNYFHQYIGLSDPQIAAVSKGTVLVKELKSPTPAEIILFGTVFVKSFPENYLKLVRNIDALGKLPDVLAILQFSTPPQLSDLRSFTLDAEDIEDLRVCIPGNCKVQLPAEEMDKLKASIDWSAKDVADQVNSLAQKSALEALIAYQQGGNDALATYRDKKIRRGFLRSSKSWSARSRVCLFISPSSEIISWNTQTTAFPMWKIGFTGRRPSSDLSRRSVWFTRCSIRIPAAIWPLSMS
jgi:hypothetical protein